MREILFRAKEESSKKWVYGYYSYMPSSAGSAHMILTPAENPDDHNKTFYIIPETIGQFTGQTDENGVKIFEGDIIRRKRVDGNWYNYEVFWWDNCWGIKGNGMPSLILPLCGLQVIGNIHDNPKLLGGAGKMGDDPAEQLGLAPAT